MSSDQWVNQCPKDLVEIARAIAATQGYDRDLAKQCETLLKKNETSPNFGVKLLKILDQNGIPDNVKQGTAIYFKRFVERYWMLEVWFINLPFFCLCKDKRVFCIFFVLFLFSFFFSIVSFVLHVNNKKKQNTRRISLHQMIEMRFKHI